MKTAEKQELIFTIKELIQNINKRIQEIAPLYQSLEYEKANKKLMLLIEDMTVLVDGLSHVEKDYIEINVEEMQEKLQLVIKELENRDYDLLASILIFELMPVLEHWEEQMIHA